MPTSNTNLRRVEPRSENGIFRRLLKRKQGRHHSTKHVRSHSAIHYSKLNEEVGSSFFIAFNVLLREDETN